MKYIYIYIFFFFFAVKFEVLLFMLFVSYHPTDASAEAHFVCWDLGTETELHGLSSFQARLELNLKSISIEK